MINSMPFTEADMREIMKDELEYVQLLKNDLAVFKRHVSLSKDKLNTNFILDMLNVSDEFANTKMFLSYKKDIIKNYVLNLRKGKIKIKNCDYSILFGNPVEMLKRSCGLDFEFIHKMNEVYTPMFCDKKELVLMRNPHICPNNVVVSVNKWHDDLKYFNLSNNIIAINSSDNDILDRLNGADFDSDTVLITNHEVILKRAKECVSYHTPISLIKIPKTQRKYNVEEKADVDYFTNGNKIGEIVNLSAILCSYYWNEYNKEDKDVGLLRDINYNVSMLSALSGVEIDKAKAFFDNNIIHISQILKSVRSLDFIELDDNNKIIRPMFFKYCAQNSGVINNSYSYKHFDCPMDYVQKILNKLPRAKREKPVEIYDIIKHTTVKNADRGFAHRFLKHTAEHRNKMISFWELNRGKENTYNIAQMMEQEFINNFLKSRVSSLTKTSFV